MVALPRSPRLAPLVRDVSDAVSNEQLRAGDRLPPLRELAKKYGISFSTARAAVAYLERAGFVERCHGSGVYVKRSAGAVGAPAERVIRRAATSQLGNWVAILVHLPTHLFDNLYEQFAMRLSAAGVLPVEMAADLGALSESLRALIDQWRRSPPRAIVLQRYTPPDLVNAIRSACPPRTRIVQFYRDPQSAMLGWHSVEPNLPAAYRMAAEQLIARGHRRIGVVSKGRNIAPDWMHTQRKAWMLHTPALLAAGHALRDAGIENGLTIHYNLLVDRHPSVIPTDDANVAHTAQWLSGPRRPAAVIGEDFRLLGVKRAAKRVGLRIPDDLELLGIGGTTLAAAGEFPSISLRYDIVARRLAELILADEETLGGVEHHIVVPPQIETDIKT